MQVGSLVECIKDNYREDIYKTPVKLPVRGQYYTVREIGLSPCGEDKAVSLLLEEIINQPRLCEYCIMRIEPRFGVERFRELLPPFSIEEAIRKEEPEQLEVIIQEEELIKEPALV